MTARASRAKSSSAGTTIERGGIQLLRPAAARAVVEDAQRRGIDVLGLDAFALTETTTRPSWAESANFTTEAGVDRGSHGRALAYLDERADRDIFFEVVLDEA